MRFLPSLETKAAKTGTGSARRMLANWSSGWMFPYLQRWSVERTVRDAWERSIWVFRCIDRIASDFASLPIILRDGDPEHGEVVENPAGADARLLHLLNKRPNPHQKARAFKYLIAVQFLLSRAGVFIEIQRNKGGGVAALYVLPPDKVAPIPHEEKFVSGFRITHAVGEFEDLPPENVLWIRKPHPTDPYSGTIPTEAAGILIDAEFYMQLFARNFALNDGRPSALIGVKGQMTTGDALELKNRFHGGPERAGEVSVIEADDISYVDLATTPREAQFVEGRKVSKQDLLDAFGVPLTMLGDASGKCVDEATEALTQRGWVNGRELTTDDQILSMDLTDGRLKWGPVVDVYRNESYTGPMWRFHHARVSAGHKWVVQARPGQGVKTPVPAPFEKKRIEDLGVHDRIFVMGDAEPGADEAEFSDAFVELVGWAVTEGSFLPSVNSREKYPNKVAPYVSIRQNLGEEFDRIERCAKEAGAAYTVSLTDEAKGFVHVRGELAAAIQQVAPDRVLTYDFMLALTAAQRELLIETMIDADGSRGASSVVYTQKSRARAENFVFLCTLAGRRCSLKHETFARSYDGQPAERWRVIVGTRKVVTVQKPGSRVRETPSAGGEFIWCPQTEHGTFVARRHGQVFVTSNTFDNADAEENVYWRVTVKPNNSIILNEFDALTEGGDEDDRFVVCDYSGVYALQRDERERAVRLQAEYDKGLITTDEYRDATGREPMARPGSRVLWVAAQGKVPVGPEADEQAALELLQAANPQPAEEEAQPALPAPGRGRRADERRPMELVKANPLWDEQGRYVGPPVEVKVLGNGHAAPDPESLADPERLARSRALDAPDLERARALVRAVSLEVKDADHPHRARLALAGETVGLDPALIDAAIELDGDYDRTAADTHLDAGGRVDGPDTAARLLERLLEERVGVGG